MPGMDNNSGDREPAEVGAHEASENVKESLRRQESMLLIVKSDVESTQREQRLMHEQNLRNVDEGKKVFEDYWKWRERTDFRLQIVQWSAVIGAVTGVFRVVVDYFKDNPHS